MSVEKAVTDAVITTTKVAEAAVKKAWSLMDAAAQKEQPSDYLSDNAVKAIQGAAKPSEQ
jgi:hypothetical protein